MRPTATLSATVLIAFEDRRGNDCDCEVNVTYKYDGAGELQIMSSEPLSPCNISDWELDELIYEAALDHAIDAYPEWLAEYGEYLRDNRRDRELV